MEQGHEVTVFHRGQAQAALPAGVRRLPGNRNQLARHAAELRGAAPEVVIDFILSSGSQARVLMDVFRGAAGRVVALSSGDVYRACGILHGFEPGPLQPLPITEDSELRTQPHPYAPELVQKLQRTMPWLDEEYDKIPVEQAVMNDTGLPGTVLRLPMVYGPGDPLHRCYAAIRRMNDARPAILIQEDAAGWRGPRGYVENVAAGIALAATSEKASGRIYNLGEPHAFSEKEWTEKLGEAAGWSGRVIPIPKELTPQHLRVPYRSEQHWIISTRRIREEIGFREPVSLATALERTVAYERACPPAEMDPSQFDYAAEDAALKQVGLELEG